MDDTGADNVFRTFLLSFKGDSCAVDTPGILPGITAYIIRSFDGAVLQFSFPPYRKKRFEAAAPFGGGGTYPDGGHGGIRAHQIVRVQLSNE